MIFSLIYVIIVLVKTDISCKIDIIPQIEFNATLLRKFFNHLTGDEQIQLATALRETSTVLMQGRKPPIHGDLSGDDIGTLGISGIVSILQQVAPCPVTAKRKIYARQLQVNERAESSSGSLQDPFIYNPFEKAQVISNASIFLFFARKRDFRLTHKLFRYQYLQKMKPFTLTWSFGIILSLI